MSRIALSKPIELFYAGTHTDFRRKVVTVDNPQLESAVSWFNANNQRLPLVVGHPVSEDDHFGEGTQLALQNGRVVVTEVENLDATFKKIVNSGELPRVSVKLRLQGHPDNKSSGIEFQHAGFFGKSRVALDKLKEAAFAAPNDKEFWFMEVDKDDALEQQRRELAAKEAAFKAEVASFKRAQAIEPELEKWVREGRVLPAEKSGFVALFAAMPEDFEISFAAPSGDVKQSGGEFLKSFLSKLAPRVVYGEVSADKGKGAEAETVIFAALKGYKVDEDAMEDHVKVMAYCKQSGLDPVKDYEQAAKQVLE
jgi:hypothetical protein